MNDYKTIYIECINSAWKLKQARNPAYSLRALARDLEISPTGLSLILNKKRPLTIERAIPWAAKLQFDESLSKKFIEAITYDSDERLNPNNRKSHQLEEKIKYAQLQLDQFALISDWYHLAILNLTKLKSFKHDPKWMSKRLGITVEECLLAIDRLIRLNLLEIIEKKYVRTKNSVSTPTDIPSEAIRNYHRQNINRAISSIENVAIEERDISSIMMPIDKSKLAEAKKMIRNFRRELALFLEAEEGDQVYSLNIQLFPQDHLQKKSA